MNEETSRTAVLNPPVSGGWEYAVISIHSRHNEALEQALSDKGRQGWEVVLINMPMPYEYQCVFKRPA